MMAIGCDKSPMDGPENLPPAEDINYVFASDETGVIEVWEQRDGERTRLSENPNENSWWPHKNPRKSSILYYTSPIGEDLQNISNAELRVLDLTSNEDHVIINAGKHDWSSTSWARWSADGEQIVVCYKTTTDSHWQLAIVDDFGNNAISISSRSDVDYLDPVFSPDGKLIYCVSIPENEGPESDNFELYSIDVATGEEIRLTNNTWRDQHPDVSPDGDWLIFESLVDPEYLSIGKWRINKYNLQSKKVEIILEEEQLNFHPKIFDEGSIVFIRLDVTKLRTGFFLMDLSTLETAPLLNEQFNAINIDPY